MPPPLTASSNLPTIAFAAFAWLTGNLCADTFLPPGKVADIFGFQYVRDSEPGGNGHNSDYAGNVAVLVLNNLTDSQLGILKQLAVDEAQLVVQDVCLAVRSATAAQ